MWVGLNPRVFHIQRPSNRGRIDKGEWKRVSRRQKENTERVVTREQRV